MFTFDNKLVTTVYKFRWVFGVSLLIVILLCYGISKKFHASNDSHLSSAEQTQSLSSEAKVVTQQDIKRLLSWNLFGQSDISKVPKSYSFQITGIVESNLPENDIVLMTAKGSEEKIYTIGDHLPNGDKIEKIESDRVLVSHDGKLHVLVFNENENSSQANNFQNFNSSSDSNVNTYPYSNMLNAKGVGRFNRIGRGGD